MINGQGFFVWLFMDFKKYIFTVSEFVKLIRDAVENAFPSVLIKGEISNFKNYTGNLFFTLKDENSQLRCVIFKGYTRTLKFVPKDGMNVIVQGTPTLYEARGDFQVIVNYMEPLGIGALKIAYEELKKKLSEKGYFDETRKKPIPPFPKTIGIVTSPKGAAIRDMLNILKRRFHNLHIIIFPVKVQGEGAAQEIADAINIANKMFADVIDVLIVGRGGGSFEDLFAFNEEVVADAIYHSKIPVISAVGHETDVTISDFVADLRASTPSAAAELVVQKKDEIVSYIFQLYKRLTILMNRNLLLWKKKVANERRVLRSPQVVLVHKKSMLVDYEAKLKKMMMNIIAQKKVSVDSQEKRLTILSPLRKLKNYLLLTEQYNAQLLKAMNNVLFQKKNTVDSLNRRLAILSPLRKVKHYRLQTDQYGNHLLRAIKLTLSRKKETFSYVTGKLEMLSPLKILSRGYSITFTKEGAVIKDASTVAINDEIRTYLHKGGIISIVTKKLNNNG